MFSAVTLSAAVGSGSDEDPIAEEIFGELKSAGHDFGEQSCNLCLISISLIPIPLDMLDVVATSVGTDTETDMFRGLQVVVSRLVS